MEEQKKVTPPWAAEMDEGDFITYEPTYEPGRYYDLYEKAFFTDSTGVDYKYYYHEHRDDTSVSKKLPLLVFFHGTSNSLVGDLCINYSGAEYYASPDYQKSMGGAHILIPIANEYRDENGDVKGYWSEELLKPAHELVMAFIRDRADKIGPVFLCGNSSGASFVMRLMDNYMDDFDVVIPIGSEALPSDEVLDEYDRKGKCLFFAMGKRDEFHDFSKDVAPRIPRLERMKHCFIYTPEWVRNGDRGIASINFGIEMGQHCLVNAMHSNLKFDDGTPMEERLPDGVTGWIARTAEEYIKK